MSELETLKLLPPRIVIDDVSCDRCGYNLRGLNDPGACPECGRAVVISLLAHAERGRVFPPIDPAWARKIMEGAALGLIAYLLLGIRCVLLPVLNALPGAWWMLIGVACCCWTACMLGAERLFRPHLRDAPDDRAGRARLFLLLYAFSPLIQLDPHLKDDVRNFAAFINIVGFYLVIKTLQQAAHLLRRAEGPKFYASAIPAIMLLKVIGALLMAIADSSQGPYLILDHLQVMPFNSAASLQDLVRRAFDPRFTFDWIVLTVGLLDLLIAILWMQILLLYRGKVLAAETALRTPELFGFGAEPRFGACAQASDVAPMPEDDHPRHEDSEDQQG